MKQYDDEQAELETKIETMKTELAEEKVSSADIKHFISLIRKCKNPTEISDTMLNDLVDKIVVYEAEGAGKARTQKVDIYFNAWQDSASVKKPTEKSERHRKSLKTVARSLRQRSVLIATKRLPRQVTDRFSVQRNAAIKQGKMERKPTEKQNEEIIITDSVNVLCVVIPIGLHTASRNSVPKNAKG